jgi:hypothetical protein
MEVPQAKVSQKAVTLEIEAQSKVSKTVVLQMMVQIRVTQTAALQATAPQKRVTQVTVVLTAQPKQHKKKNELCCFSKKNISAKLILTLKKVLHHKSIGVRQ